MRRAFGSFIPGPEHKGRESSFGTRCSREMLLQFDDFFVESRQQFRTGHGATAEVLDLDTRGKSRESVGLLYSS